MNYRIGDRIRIIKMADCNGADTQATAMNGKTGTVTYVDGIGQLHGTWGGLAVIPQIDKIEIINE